MIKRKEFPAEEYKMPAHEAVERIDKELAMILVYDSVPSEAKELLVEPEFGRSFLEYASRLTGRVAPLVEVKEVTIGGGRGDGMSGRSPIRKVTREYEVFGTGYAILETEMREKVDELSDRVKRVSRGYEGVTEEDTTFATEVKTFAEDYLARIDEIERLAKTIC